MSWPTMLVMVLLVAGCQEEPSQGPAASVPRPSSSVPAPRATKGEDEPIITVDDTVPAPSAPGEPPKDDDASPGSDDEDTDDDCAPPEADLEPLQLLRFVFTSGVEGKDPKDKLQVARPGQRVYAHLTLRNRSGRKRCAKLTFRVGGKKRTEVTLKIGESWSWRTWAFNTIKSEDRGPLELTITDGRGDLILKKTLPVVPE